MNTFEQKFKEKTGESFPVYYKKYRPKLSWYLFRYTKNIETAEEFADMAFTQGLEKIDTYNNDIAQFITWVTSIAVNLVIKDYKDRKKANLTSIDEEISENLTLSTFLQHHDNDEEKILHEENKAKCDIIKDVIDSLPEKYKKVMELRELKEKPYKEIADIITREYETTITTDEYFSTNDLFQSATITNYGSSNVIINYEEGGYSITLPPNEKKIIDKEEADKKIKLSEVSNINIKVIESTNLSTIKSQIKKGRHLIRKKVKRSFELIDKNGIK